MGSGVFCWCWCWWVWGVLEVLKRGREWVLTVAVELHVYAQSYRVSKVGYERHKSKDTSPALSYACIAWL